jgi:hypothetical protein
MTLAARDDLAAALLVVALLAVLALLSCCARLAAIEGPQQAPPVCATVPTEKTRCQGLYLSLSRCFECAGEHGCFVPGDDVYCARSNCLDECVPPPVPLGARRTPDGGLK